MLIYPFVESRRSALEFRHLGHPRKKGSQQFLLSFSATLLLFLPRFFFTHGILHPQRYQSAMDEELANEEEEKEEEEGKMQHSRERWKKVPITDHLSMTYVTKRQEFDKKSSTNGKHCARKSSLARCSPFILFFLFGSQYIAISS